MISSTATEIQIVPAFGFIFNDRNDFNYPDHRLYYQEKIVNPGNGTTDGEILINIDAALRNIPRETAGEMFFIHKPDALKVVYSPQLGLYLSTPEESLASLYNNFKELEVDSPEAQAHQNFFAQVFEWHPLGTEFKHIYMRRFSYEDEDLRHHTLGYLGHKLKQEPSLLETLLEQTGGESCGLKFPYWTPESKNKFLTRIKTTLR